MTSASADPNDDGYANSVCQRILQTTLQELTKSVVVNQASENLIGNAADVLSKRIGHPVEVSIAPLSTKPGEGPLVGMLAAGQAALHTLRTIERCVTDQLQQHLIRSTAHGLEEALRAAGVRVIVAKPQPPKVL